LKFEKEQFIHNKKSRLKMNDKSFADLNLNSSNSTTDAETTTELSEDSFKNLQNACLLGMDIGGSLIKIAYSSSYDVKTSAFTEVRKKYTKI
jgi:hypothetical protein